MLSRTIILGTLLLGFSVATSDGYLSRSSVLLGVLDAAAHRSSSRSKTRRSFLPRSVNTSADTNRSILQAQQSQDDVISSDEKKNPSQKYLVGATFLSGLTAATAAAKSGLLRGPWDEAIQAYSVYTDGMILQDLGTSVLTAALAFVFIKLITLGYEKDVYNANVARKLIHTLSAPLFMLFWPLFTSSMDSRFFAACVPLANMVRLIIAGTGGDSSLASSLSRSGDKAEALGGPLLYVIVLQLCILLFWRGPVGVVTASTMAFGDGMADLVGRKFGRNNKWFFSEDKSIAGTVAFAVSSALGSFGLLGWLQFTGCISLPLDPMDLFLRVSAISCICSFVELLDIGNDNYTVPGTACLLSGLLLK